MTFFGNFSEHDMANLIDLHFGMHKRSPFSLAASKTLLKHLLEALNHIHSHYIIHRDVKLTNLLYSNRGFLKLADFGLSRPYAAHDNRVLTQNVASLWYRPPELLLGSKIYGQSIDIWAVGCVFAEFLAGQPLMNGKTEEEQFRLMVDCIGIPSTREWPELMSMPRISSSSFHIPSKSRRTVLDTFSDLSKAGLDLQSRLLHYDSHQRWTAAECLGSTFFSEFPFPLRPEKMPNFPTL
jgi:cyclin-dependent kinase 10